MPESQDPKPLEFLPEDDPRMKEAIGLANEITALLKGHTIDAVLNSMAIILSDFLSQKNEEERKNIFDSFAETVKRNTRHIAGEATA
jgi:hypothetical protein